MGRSRFPKDRNVSLDLLLGAKRSSRGRLAMSAIRDEETFGAMLRRPVQWTGKKGRAWEDTMVNRCKSRRQLAVPRRVRIANEQLAAAKVSTPVFLGKLRKFMRHFKGLFAFGI